MFYLFNNEMQLIRVKNDQTEEKEGKVFKVVEYVYIPSVKKIKLFISKKCT